MAASLPVFLGRDLELLFVTSVLRLNSLHYGFWESRLPVVTLSSLRDAQARFTVELIKMVPRDAKTVLDVGAGIGDNARALAQRGLDVTAISPDRNHAKYFRKLETLNIRYSRTKFEDLELPHEFDLVFMCESLNYFDREVGLQQCRRYVAPGGHLLVAAMFQAEKPSAPFFRPGDLPYVGLAERYGFFLVAGRNVTENVLPTIEYAHRGLQRFVFPLVRFASAASVTGRLLRKTPLRKTTEAIDSVRAFYERRTEPDWYEKHMRYVFLLFSRSRRESRRDRV